MKLEMIRNSLKRFNTGQKDFMKRFTQVKDFWWYNSIKSESSQMCRKPFLDNI